MTPPRMAKYSLRAPRGQAGTTTVLPDTNYDFKLYVLKHGVADAELLDPFVTTFSIVDEGPITTGEVTLGDPRSNETVDFGIQEGDRVYCLVGNGTDAMMPWWEMRVTEPDQAANAGQATLQLELDLSLLARSTDDFKFAKDKQHPHGWLASEIATWVAEKYRLPIDTIDQTAFRIKSLIQIGWSPYDILVEAYKRERHQTGHRFVISYTPHRGLKIIRMTRSDLLLSLGPQIIEATLQRQMDQRFATAVTVRSDVLSTTGTDKKGHRKGTVKKTAAQGRLGSDLTGRGAR